jgi:hypothetical protein
MTINSIRAVELSEGNLHLKVTNDELQNVKRGWHGVGKDATGLLIRNGGDIYILMKVR